MKKKRIFIKKRIVQGIGLIVILFPFLAAQSCKSQDSEKVKQKDEIVEDMKQVTEETTELLSMKKKELNDKLEKMISEYDEQSETFQENLKDEGEILDEKSAGLLLKLDGKRDSLQEIQSEINAQTEDTWKEFSAQLTSGMKGFQKSVSDFFGENN